ncbi:uncharacterized protein [Periplaneta americana]|uniref:uncharacterized protein n=1 Tax=Periplaneta americana TaxID=6978 RepID=UPI0037E8BB5D
MSSPTKRLSTNDPDYEEWKKEQVKQIHNITNTEGHFQSPIDLNIKSMKVLELPALNWHNYNHVPVKMKLTNSGHTVILSAKWGQDRPYISDGPLLDSGYVFSQLHFHWGENDCEGSEHTVEGTSFPMEMHVVHFKTCYLTQESALREKDGMVIIVYFFKLQSNPNPEIKKLADFLHYVKQPHTSSRIEPLPLSSLVKQFQRDYFLYWGSVMTSTCAHLIMWVISREPIGINSEQLAKFRTLLDNSEEPMMGNFRDTQPLASSFVFHVSPSSSRTTTLLPISQPQYSTSQPGPSSKHDAAFPPSAIQKQSTSTDKGQPQYVAVYREMASSSDYPFSVNYTQPLVYTVEAQGCAPLNMPVGQVMIPLVPITPEGNENMNIHYGALDSNKTESSVDKQILKKHTAAKNYDDKLSTNKRMSSQNEDLTGQNETYLIKNMDSANSRKNVKFNRTAEVESEIKRKLKTGHLQEQGIKVVLPKGTKLINNSVPVGIQWPPNVSHRPNKMPESCKEAKYYDMSDSNFSEPFG